MMQRTADRPVVIEANDVKTWFPLEGGLLSSLLRRGEIPCVRAVDGVSLRIHEGEILALAGESGCGKSTMGMTLVRLYEPTHGIITFEGRDIARLKGAELKGFRRRAQIVFQDPYASINPRLTIGQVIREPLIIHGIGTPDEQHERVLRALESVKLVPPQAYVDRFPHELSGGQRQRVAIARALVLEPRLIVADEAVSMLDVSVRAGILELLRELSDTLGLAVLYISHDISTIRYISDSIAVMYLGRIVEYGPTESVIANPCHPYTKALMAAVPIPDPHFRRERVELPGDVPTPVAIPSGCRFRTRCVSAMPECAQEIPAFREIEPGHYVSCYLY